MERSGNFYKAIQLGYILISILIGCMDYMISSQLSCFIATFVSKTYR